MSSKYIDIAAIIQVIGNVYNHPQLLDLTDKYIITDEDFDNMFHKVVFGSILKLYDLGSSKVTIKNILDFLSTRPEYEAIFKANKGEEWLARASENADYNSFDYYYGRMKKMSLLRAYDHYGVDVSFLYDPDNILDVKKKQLQEEWLDNSSLTQIADKIDERIDQIKTELDQTSSTTKANVDALTSKLNIDKQDKSFMLENLIDLIDAKMQLVTELVDEVTLA